MFYTAVCCYHYGFDQSFGFYGVNQAKSQPKILSLKELRKIVNENLDGMVIDEFFPGSSPKKFTKKKHEHNPSYNPCLEDNLDSTAYSNHVIKHLSQKLDEKQKSRYENVNIEIMPHIWFKEL